MFKWFLDGGIINSYIIFWWVWVLAATSQTSPKLQRSSVMWRIEIRSGCIWRWFPHNLKVSVNELVERNAHGDDFSRCWEWVSEWMNEGTDSQQEFPFAKMQKPLQNPAKKKTWGYELTNRKPTQSTKSFQPKFSLKQTTTNQRWRNPTPIPPNSSEPSSCPTKFPPKSKMEESQNSTTHKLQFTSLLILPQPPTHNATINEIWLNALCNQPPSLG